jgi:hypothetical protein
MRSKDWGDNHQNSTINLGSFSMTVKTEQPELRQSAQQQISNTDRRSWAVCHSVECR